jgi:hypothetical protein
VLPAGSCGAGYCKNLLTGSLLGIPESPGSEDDVNKDGFDITDFILVASVKPEPGRDGLSHCNQTFGT